MRLLNYFRLWPIPNWFFATIAGLKKESALGRGLLKIAENRINFSLLVFCPKQEPQ